MNQDKPRPRFRLPNYIKILLIVCAAPVVLFAQASKVTSSEGGYSVVFPTSATRQTTPPTIENGVTSSSEMYSAAWEEQIFVTVFTRYEGANINTEKELQANVDNFAKGVSATGLTTKSIQYSSPWRTIAGIEYTCHTDQYSFHGKFFVAGNEVWGISYAARKGSESEATKAQFLGSLEIGSRPKGEHGPD